MHPITVRIRGSEPPHTGDLVSDTKTCEFRCDCADVGHYESELHPGDRSVPRRKKLKNGTGLACVTVDYVWSASMIVVEQRDAYGAVEGCGVVDIAYK